MTVRVGIIVRDGCAPAIEVAHSLALWTRRKSGTVFVLEGSTIAESLASSGVPCEGRTNLEEVVRCCSLVVTLGGDGTFLSAARFARGSSPILIGVNFGTLGFLTETLPHELLETCERVLTGEAPLGVRTAIEAMVEREGRELFQARAVNDVVIQKSFSSKLVGFTIKANGEEVMHIRADGIIIATATGSTGYSLAAGGCICHPQLPVVLLTPICPHSVTMRPLVLPLDYELQVDTSKDVRAHEILVTIDGQVAHTFDENDKLLVRRSIDHVTYVHSHTHSYFDILKSKLSLGADYRISDISVGNRR
jgi:NAD+ kinase